VVKSRFEENSSSHGDVQSSKLSADDVHSAGNSVWQKSLHKDVDKVFNKVDRASPTNAVVSLLSSVIDVLILDVCLSEQSVKFLLNVNYVVTII